MFWLESAGFNEGLFEFWDDDKYLTLKGGFWFKGDFKVVDWAMDILRGLYLI